MDKRQVVVIHGGTTFDTYDDYLAYLKSAELDIHKASTKRWKDSLPVALGEEYEVIAPSMPCGKNAKYVEWKIWFDKYVPHLKDGVILVGHSLGGIFLVKYLSENRLPVQIKGVFLVAPPFGPNGPEDTLADFTAPLNADLLWSQCGNIVFYFSSDDQVVPISNMDPFRILLPFARYSVYGDRGHFIQETFPEIVEEIKLLG